MPAKPDSNCLPNSGSSNCCDVDAFARGCVCYGTETGHPDLWDDCALRNLSHDSWHLQRHRLWSPLNPLVAQMSTLKPLACWL